MSSLFEPVEIRVKRRLEWRLSEGFVELHDPARATWARMAPWTRAVFSAIDEGASAEEIFGLDPEREPALRRLIMSLAKVGYLDMPVPIPCAPGFAIERELGRGGVGIAYLATDLAREDQVVVKRAWGFLHPLALAQAALAREAETLRALDSPHIVPLRGSIEHGGDHLIVRGLARGDALAQSAADLSRARRVADGLGAALEAMHRAGYALADHKPGNLFDDGAHVVLVDVGNARRIDVRARSRGTRGFAAPEGETSVAADIYGLGRMVAFALTARMFRRDPSPADVVEGLPPVIAATITTICAAEPAARPSLAQARDLLSRALA